MTEMNTQQHSHLCALVGCQRAVHAPRRHMCVLAIFALALIHVMQSCEKSDSKPVSRSEQAAPVRPEIAASRPPHQAGGQVHTQATGALHSEIAGLLKSLKAAHNIGNESDREQTILNALDWLSDDSLESAFGVLLSDGELGDAKWRCLAKVVERLGRSRPEVLPSICATLPPGGKSANLVAKGYSAIQAKDIQGSLLNLKGVASEDFKTHAIRGLLSSASTAVTERKLDLNDALVNDFYSSGVSLSDLAKLLASDILANPRGYARSRELLAQFKGNQVEEQDFRTSLISHLGYDAQSAALVSDQLAGGDLSPRFDRFKTFLTVFSRSYAESNPSEAATWAVTQRDDEARPLLVNTVVSAWFDRDPTGLAHWLSALPHVVGRDAAVTSAMRACRTAEKRGFDAPGWLNSIENAEIRSAYDRAP